SVRNLRTRVVTVVIALVLLVGFYSIEAKVWGVALMGLSLFSFFLLPWLDRSPVKSIRYRGWMYKAALALFAISFIVLGYLGTRSPSGFYSIVSKIGLVIYFLFFLLMPWYTTF